jgi:DNA-binding NarL/FixJ family response regulator
VPGEKTRAAAASTRSLEDGAGDDWVARRVLPSDTAQGLRAAVVRDLIGTSGAGLGAYHNVVVVDGELYWHDLQPQGDPAGTAFLRALSGRPVSEVMDVTPAALSTVNRFSEVTDEDFRSNKAYAAVWRPLKLVSCVAMNAVVGNTLVGWVGAWRLEGQGPFGRPVLKQLQGRADAYLRCLETASRLDGLSVGVRGLILLTAAGEVAFACEAGRRWQADASLLARLRDAVRLPEPLAPFSAHGTIVRISRVESESGDRLYCADLVPVDAWQVPELITFSVQQRRVAEFAALGATAPEIARSLGVSDSTVRTYLKQIYDKLGIASRVELAEHVRSACGPRP